MSYHEFGHLYTGACELTNTPPFTQGGQPAQARAARGTDAMCI